MWYSHPDVNVFVEYVGKNYFCRQQDVRKIIDDHYNEVLRECPIKRTKKVKENLLQEVLSNCRVWLAEERKQIKSDDLVVFRLAKNYFNSLEKR